MGITSSHPGFHEATERGDTKTIKKILKKKSLFVDCFDDNKRTALFTACDKGFYDVAALLLDKGARIDMECPDEIDWISIERRGMLTPLHVAAKNGKLEVVKLLLRRGADVHRRGREYPTFFYTPLHLACRSGFAKVAEELLDNGADIHAPYEFRPSHGGLASGGTALHLAADGAHVATVKLLLSRNADVNAVCHWGFSALHCACRSLVRFHREEVVSLLIENGACVNSAIHEGSPSFEGFTPLHAAVVSGSEEMVQRLLHFGADVNAAGRDGIPPLHLALLRDSPLRLVRCLLNGGANINAAMSVAYMRYVKESTPLHVAAYGTIPEMAQLLFDWGADVNAVDDHGRTPLVAALVDRDLVANGLDDFEANDFLAAEDRSNRAVVRVFVKQLMKMRAQGMLVSEDNLQAFSNDEEWGNTGLACKNEIAYMLRRKIDNGIFNFFDLLTKGTRQLAKILENDQVAEVLESEDFEAEFLIYGSQMREKVRQGRERRDFQRQVDDVFRSSDLRCLPYSCLQQITSYLDIDNLKKLVSAKWKTST